MIRPAHYAVCNAVGAALCSVSGTIESIVDLIPSTVDGGEQRQSELNRLMTAVREQCEQNGAQPSTIQVAEIEQVPLTYYPDGYRHRVLLTAIGQLAMTTLRGEKSGTGETTVVPLDIVEGAAQDAKAPVFINMANKAPIFDEQGVWKIDAIDIEYIAYGAGILGKRLLIIEAKRIFCVFDSQVVVVEEILTTVNSLPWNCFDGTKIV